MNSAIHLENIRKSLGGREVLKGISFSVEKGDIFGYLGPNGAGKTTSIRILLGLLKASSGSASILGKDVSLDESRRHIGFLLEGDGLYDMMTGEENLEYYAQIYRVSESKDRINQLLDMVRLRDRAKDRVGTYSKGMRQRLALARSMIHDPDILILDEPSSGIDPTGFIQDQDIWIMYHG